MLFIDEKLRQEADCSEILKTLKTVIDVNKTQKSDEVRYKNFLLTFFLPAGIQKPHDDLIMMVSFYLVLLVVCRSAL